MGPDWLIYIRLLFAFLLLLQPASACLLGCSMGKRGAEKFQNLHANNGPEYKHCKYLQAFIIMVSCLQNQMTSFYQ